MADPLEIGRLAGEAMAQAMYTHTFGIVSDQEGMEGKGLGTGVGVIWRGRHLIVTAMHVVKGTAPERIYYLLPEDTLQIEESSASVDWSRVRWAQRYQLENPRILFGDKDIAVIVLPEQVEQAGRRHFHRLDESGPVPGTGTTVGYLGYPATLALPVGENYAARPYYAFGEICMANCGYDTGQEFAIRYGPGNEVDPHGLSGSGAWHSHSTGRFWSPELSLAGLVTHYFRNSQVLICCRIETITSFLKQHDTDLSVSLA